MDHEALPLPVLEFKENIVDPDAEADFSGPTSILALTSLRKGRPRMSGTPKLPSLLRTTKSARMKEFLTRTSRFSTIPSGYQIVELVSCT
jgi:hypothetical protein